VSGRIVVGSSALLAILFREPERDSLIELLLNRQPVISIATLTEISLVLFGRRGPAALDELDRQIAGYRFEIRAVEADDHRVLRQAMLDFGKGRRRPPAVLNFGDLFAYALAKRLGLPLLYKGGDFAQTDVEAVRL
jgi:ribonuclease VapC